MARVDLRHPANAAGDWFVDERCIDCGTCRELAPALFADVGPQSVVSRQPASPADEVEAWLAAQACPTQSIGTASRQPRPGRLFPREIAPGTDVFDCGYCSPDSFGATAWFARRAAGNVMVDSPRFTPALLRAAPRDGWRAGPPPHPPRRRRRRRALGGRARRPGVDPRRRRPRRAVRHRRHRGRRSRGHPPRAASPCRCPATRRARPSSSSTTRTSSAATRWPGATPART